MEIQIVNLLPPDMPYQVTKMKKQMKEHTLYYDMRGNEIQKDGILYILIAGKQVELAERWIKEHDVRQKQVILFLSEHHREYCCWSMMKAFEKEFDAEKMMMMLGCILSDCKNADLYQSYELKLYKFRKEECCAQLEARLKKREISETKVHVFVKEKCKKLLNEDGMTIRIFQHWIKGVDDEAEVLFVKRKS